MSILNFKKTEKKPIWELKQYLKDKAIGIRNIKDTIKSTMRSGDYAGYMQGELNYKLKPDYRHHHIVYCELRGKTRDQIEKPGKDNLPNEGKIKEIESSYEIQVPTDKLLQTQSQA